MTFALPPELGLPMVHLVDDEPAVRHAVAWLLRSRRLLSTEYPSAEAFLAALPTPPDDDWPPEPSCLLLDLRMGGMSGVALFEQLAARRLVEVMPVIFLTGHGDVPTAVATVQRGAFDFVEKPFSDNGLVDRIERALVASARRLVARRERARSLRQMQELSERERTVMWLIAEGHPNKQVAETMHLSVRTVEAQRAHVFQKMNVGSAVELANLLNRLGVVAPWGGDGRSAFRTPGER